MSAPHCEPEDAEDTGKTTTETGEHEETEITPEMINAGVNALLALEDETFSGRAASSVEASVIEVFEAMARAAPRRC
jgi:hypothetical protein